MNLSQLETSAAEIGIEPAALALGARAEQAWCIERAADGQWEVFWCERGGRQHLVRMPSEADACYWLLGRLAYSQLLAGVIGR